MNVVLRYEINNFARVLYLMHGYKVEPGYDFSKAKHPQEKLMWAMAKLSYDYWAKPAERKEGTE